ncbi:hypothetical protein KIH86_08455 [Paenibacillus sp. HN-1]|uniref:hypothetical protein n=1 Tax=Paenibacillus TaxID=44249 RepID=UPI001CA7FAB3|nr:MULTISPECIES: hypothetical protein [Paenibacillus]MBY9079581.1 hypothetical protein [Paenibacillus sp. CGMCC 1.18879]MBY9084270.1 hypothetical protein [Paenibacillus sinensis]
MLVASGLLFVGVVFLLGGLLHMLLPGFTREKRYATQALLLSKSAAERQRMQYDPITLAVADRLPGLEKRLGLGIIGKLRRMYMVLDKEHSFEMEVAGILVKSVIGALPLAVLPFILGAPALLFAIPAGVVLFFALQLNEIPKAYKTRQMEITKDLPQLISKMMIALETGKSFITTIQRLEETSGPRMKKMLARLNANLRVMNVGAAMDLFAKETGVPVMREFAAAVKIGNNAGYEEAKSYFESIKDELKKLRLVSLKEVTRNQPEKVKRLYVLVAVHAFIAVIMAFVAVMSEMQSI